MYELNNVGKSIFKKKKNKVRLTVKESMLEAGTLSCSTAEFRVNVTSNCSF